MGTLFAKLLVAVRKSAGFPTAYKFFYGNGGRAVMGMTYRQYLLIEQGKTVPPFKRLHVFIRSLRLVPQSCQANNLIIAWLQSMAGAEEFEELLSPLLRDPGCSPGEDPMHRPMQKSLNRKARHITPEELTAIMTNADSFLCYISISKDSGPWKPVDLAAKLRIRRSAAEKALSTLAEAGLLKRLKTGKYICPDAGAMLVFPDSRLVSRELIRKIEEYQERLITAGEPQFLLSGFIRADSEEFHDFYPLLRLNLSTAEAYNVTERTRNSALFCVEGKITKLLDF